MDKPLFVHVGYPKTGTTLLQGEYFSKHPEIGYVGKPTPKHADSRLFELKRELLETPATQFEPEDVQAGFEELFEEVDSDGVKVFGVSLESLTHFSFKNDRSQRWVCERIGRVFANEKPRIIVGIRNQVSAIPSYYVENVKCGEISSLRRILFSPDSVQRRRYLENFQYLPTIAGYKEIFEGDNVFVYPKELLDQNYSDFFLNLAEFIGVKKWAPELSKRINPRLSSVGAYLMRNFINPFFETSYNSTGIMNPVADLVSLAAGVIAFFDREQKLINYDLPRDRPESYRFYLERGINGRLHRGLIRAVAKKLDSLLFSRISSFEYQLPPDLEAFVEKYYAPTNRQLMEEHNLELDRYGYPGVD